MSSFIFVCFIFALVPAILWIIPKPRRSSGMIMTALKTVPLGMLAFFALNHLPQNMALLSGTLCWAIIILLAAFIRKRYKANWKYPAFIFLVAIPFSVFCLAAAIATSIFCSTVRYFADSEHYHGEWFATAIPLPGESKTKLSLEQRSIHPFLAEYDYQLVFERDVEHGAGDDAHQLRLRVGRGLEVKSAQDSEAGARFVVLNPVAVDSGFAVFRFVPGFKEVAARIAEKFRFDDFHFREFRFNHIHCVTSRFKYCPYSVLSISSMLSSTS